jgi:hypothetical protein
METRLIAFGSLTLASAYQADQADAHVVRQLTNIIETEVIE